MRVGTFFTGRAKGSLLIAVLLTVTVGSLSLGIWPAEVVAGDQCKCRSPVIPPTGFMETVYEYLAAEWWQWAAGPPIDINPLLDETGEHAGVGQKGPVWFLAGTTGNDPEVYDPVEREVTIPRAKFLFFPVLNVLCWSPEDVEFWGANPDELTPEEQEAVLREVCNWWMSAATEVECYIDGEPVEDLWSHRVVSPAFAVEGGEVFGIQPGRELCVADGWWVLLKPLSPGEHVIESRGVLTFTEEEHGFDWVFESHVIYYLTVEGRRPCHGHDDGHGHGDGRRPCHGHDDGHHGHDD